ncbi:MAG: hypothetical protein ACR2N7_08525 [Acidimicrobiia bacterium]
MLFLAIGLLAVTLAPPFGVAEAAAVSDADGLTVEVSVELTRSTDVVLVRPFSSFEELPPTALRDRGDGTWGGLVVLPTADNWSIVFELIDPDGSTVRSDTTDLIEMGVDPVVVAGEPTTPIPRETINATTWWLVGAVLLALAAIGALVWWAFSSDESVAADDHGSSEDSPD